nr:YhdT family protein [Salsuginibacillus kocurii]
MTDRRMKVAHREAKIGVGLALIHFILWFALAYGLGSGDVADYTYVFGMPAWFFYSCIVLSGFMIIVVTFVVKLFFKEVPFEDQEEERETK